MSAIIKVIVTILTALLTIFPHSPTLLAYHQNLTFIGRDAIADIVITAIKENDADAIVNLMSEETKERLVNPEKEVADFISMFKGDIVEAKYRNSSGGGMSNYGYAFTDIGWSYNIKTTQEAYILHISWIAVNTAEPDTVGLKGMTLFLGESASDFEVLKKL